MSILSVDKSSSSSVDMCLLLYKCISQEIRSHQLYLLRVMLVLLVELCQTALDGPQESALAFVGALPLPGFIELPQVPVEQHTKHLVYLMLYSGAFNLSVNHPSCTVVCED